ncbi:hypothetical protein GJ496_002442 [Pomphorhynchus laevis]|nr:hypothetical protein GJ496_002442 [Pomphorhynchus laevis]
MGKRYYCDYCNVTIPPDMQSRRKHISGFQHQKFYKDYYTKFKPTLQYTQSDTLVSKSGIIANFGKP